MNLELKPVTSHLIDAVNYDVDDSMLFIRFKGKSDVYSYQNVSPELFEEMVTAESIGSFFLHTIKPFKDKFPYAKLEAATPTDFTGDGTPLPVPAREPEITVPADPEALKSAAIALSDQAKTIIIETPEAYSLAATTLLAIARMRGGLEKTFRPEIDRTHRLHAAACAVLNHYDKPLEGDERRLKAGMSEFNRREEQKRLRAEAAAREEQQRIADAEAKRRAEELQLADALAAEERGDSEIADVIMQSSPLPVSPAYVPPVSFASTVPKTKGISHVEDWTYEILDESKIPRKYLIVDERALRNEARTLKGRAQVEGVRFFDQGGVRASKRA